MKSGSLAALSRSVGLKTMGGVGRGSALRGESPLHICESVHNLRTISSSGATVKPPPCMHRARSNGGMRGRPGRRSSPRPSRLAPDGHPDRLDAPGTPQDGAGDGLADGQHHVVDNLARDGGRQLLPAGSHGTPQPARQLGDAARRFQLSPAARVAAVTAWRGILQAREVQLRHRTGAGAAWRQPSRSPRQSPPAATVTAPFLGWAAFHRPLGPPQPVQLRRQRPGAVLQILQVAVAVERPPVNVARPAAPVAGLRSTRTGVVGLRPARAAASLVQPRAGRDGDLPGPARLPAAHEASPPWPGSQAPTNPPGGHGQAGAASRFHRTPRR